MMTFRAAQDPQTALRRMWEAAEQLRVELDKPGGYHRRRAKGVAEPVMDQRLGTAQESALDAWGELYGATSTVLHGSASQQAAVRYQQVVRLAREVFVPLPGRAEQILELAERQEPTAEDAAVLAEWADPCATRYFFLSRPAAAWLELLDDVLLLPDTSSPAGSWPAAPYLDHLTQTAPDRVRQWLADHAKAAAAAGPDATAALLRLAARPGIALTREVRAVITDLTHPSAIRGPRMATREQPVAVSQSRTGLVEALSSSGPVGLDASPRRRCWGSRRRSTRAAPRGRCGPGRRWPAAASARRGRRGR
nr:hypothetical protein [Streptomyces himalayensis]